MPFLTPYVRAAYPAVAVETVEEERFLGTLLSELEGRPVLTVAADQKLRDAREGGVVDPACPYPKAFQHVAQREDHVLVVFDFQHVVQNPAAYRALKQCFSALKARGSIVVLVAPAWKLPPELEHDVPVLQWRLPTREELRQALDLVAEAAGVQVPEEEVGALLDAASGLTLQEAENTFALSLAERAKFDARLIEREKMRLVRQSGYLEVWPPVPPEEVGGLGGLKDYFIHEVVPAKDDPLLAVRGILLVGVPGTGKSLSAKAAGALLGWPVLRLDISSLKGSLVGQSEQNMRNALKVADAVAPCVLWLDEIEKGVGGYASSAHTDSGTTLGMVGILLTWMQEHTSPVLVVATCNDYQKLPPELTRAGRFDERFFVDLPSLPERREIAAVHLRKYGCWENVPDPEALTDHIAHITQDWTGAEIEQLVKSAARRTRRTPTPDVIEACAREIKPISRVRAQEIEELRRWARESLRLANTPDGHENPAQEKLGRKLDL